MFGQLTSAISVWFGQVSRIATDTFMDLEPREYFTLLVITIVLGYMLLRGRN